jgi:Domain of unknown function (DUF4399)
MYTHKLQRFGQFLGFILALMGGYSGFAYAQTPSEAGALVYFISPKDGETVKSPLTVQFGLKAMGVAPALVEWPKTGHHHLIIDKELPDLTKPIPANDPGYKHLGGGQTETVLELSPGVHKLQLLLGDHNHVPHNPPLMSSVITITVE